MEQSRAEKKENLQAKNKTKKREKTRTYETAKNERIWAETIDQIAETKGNAGEHEQ